MREKRRESGAGAPRSGPVRTCAGCRRQAAPEELLRFVADERGHLRLDLERRAAGRGAHVCATRPCLESALRQGFARSLRRKLAGVAVEGFVEGTRVALEQAARELGGRALCDGRAVASETAGAVLRDPRARRRLERWRAQAEGLASRETIV